MWGNDKIGRRRQNAIDLNSICRLRRGKKWNADGQDFQDERRFSSYPENPDYRRHLRSIK